MTTYCTYDEIKSQTPAWAQALERASSASLPPAEDYDQVIFTGCGSTYYLSLAAAALYQELTGRPARAAPAGELWLNPRVFLAGQKTLLVAVSRSGTTTETVRAVEGFKSARRGDVVVISNYDEELSRMADVRIVIERGQEESIAQTRSFASMYVASAAFSAHHPRNLRSVWRRHRTAVAWAAAGHRVVPCVRRVQRRRHTSMQRSVSARPTSPVPGR